MFKIELDQKWVEKELKYHVDNIKKQVGDKLEHVMRGLVSDFVKQAIVAELAKPENKAKLTEIVEEILTNKQAADIVRHFMGRYV